MLTFILYGLHLSFLLLLNPTLAFPTLNATLSGKIVACIPQSPPSRFQVPTAIYADCIRAILTWSTTPNRNKPTTFSRDPSKGYQVPHEIKLPGCIFKIDLANEASGVASIADVAREAGWMAKECVLGGEHTGGVAWVGRGNEIEVVLHGPTGLEWGSGVDEWK